MYDDVFYLETESKDKHILSSNEKNLEKVAAGLGAVAERVHGSKGFGGKRTYNKRKSKKRKSFKKNK